MAQEKRKPFKGKKLHKDLRDYKNQEIKRSLVHRARLRKNYFKLLEKEGLPAGQDEYESKDSDGKLTNKSISRDNSETQASPASESEQNSASDDESASEDGSGDESDEKSADSGEISTRKRHAAPLPPQKDLKKVVPKTRDVQPKRKPLNFAERAKLAKERKEQKREEELKRVQERRQRLAQSQKEREQKKLSLQKRTRRGQPVMGPKINDLLDKIRQNN
ncbi:hypothetical protein OXX59_004036 [Metschnikowia pulcherrima]